MTGEQARALGERWIMRGGACLGGMRDLATGLVYRFDDDCLDDAVPDFRAGCTKGAAMDLVRERLNAPDAVAVKVGDEDDAWAVFRSARHFYRWAEAYSDAKYRPLVPYEDDEPVWSASEAEAIVAALEAAP